MYEIAPYCDARSSQDPSLVDTPEMAGMLVTDGLKDTLLAQTSGAEYGTFEYELGQLHSVIDSAINIGEDGSVSIAEDLSGDDAIKLSLVASMSQASMDCSGCEYETVCKVDSIFIQTQAELAERQEMGAVLEAVNLAPTWMRGAWVHHASQRGKKLTSATKDALLSDQKLNKVPDLNSDDLAAMIHLPSMEIKHAETIVAKDIRVLESISGVRHETKLESVTLQAPNHQIRINDARPAITANNNQSPNENDVNAMLYDLLERAPKIVGDKTGANVIPALAASSVKSGYSPLMGYKGEGSLNEFRMWGEGSKSRLYGISVYDDAGRLVEFTILGATSGNGNAAQDQFLKGIGL